jgi:hypothetical protein
VVADLLGCIYAMLRGDFLRACSALFAGAAAWQEREVALYALRQALLTEPHLAPVLPFWSNRIIRGCMHEQ